MRRPVQSPQSQVSESLAAPGVAAIPGDSAGVVAANELLQALSAVGSVAGALNQVSRDRAYRARREQTELEQAAREHRIIVEGNAAEAARTEAPGIIQNIADGNVPIPDDIPAFATKYAEDRVKDIPDENYRNKYRELLAPRVADALVTRKAVLNAEARKSTLSALAETAATASDEKGIRVAIEEGRSLYGKNTPDDEIIASIVLPAAQAAAINGDTNRLEAARKVLDGKFPDKMAALDVTYTEAKNRERAGNRRVFNEAIDASLVDERPYSVIRDQIKAWRGKVDDTSIDAKLQEVDGREAADAARNAATLKRIERQQFEDDTTQEAITHLLNADRTGGAAMWGDRTHTYADGSEQTIDSKKALAKATDEIFARIDQGSAQQIAALQSDMSTSPELQQAQINAVKQANFTSKARFLNETGAEYEPWTNLLNGGVQQINIQSLSKTTEDGKQPQLPEAVAQSFGLWEKLGANPALRNRLTTSTRARFVYSTAEMVKHYITGDDTVKALTMALRATSDRDAWSEALSMQLPSKEFKSAVAETLGDARNAPEISQDIENLARYAMSPALGLPGSEAITWATEQIKQQTTKINGWMVSTVNHHVPDFLPEIAVSIAEDYAARHRGEGVDASDLTLIPEVGGYWMLVNGRDGTPVDYQATEGTFHSRDILAKYGKTIMEHRKRMHEQFERSKSALSEPGTIGRRPGGPSTQGDY